MDAALTFRPDETEEQRTPNADSRHAWRLAREQARAASVVLEEATADLFAELLSYTASALRAQGVLDNHGRALRIDAGSLSVIDASTVVARVDMRRGSVRLTRLISGAHSTITQALDRADPLLIAAAINDALHPAQRKH